MGRLLLVLAALSLCVGCSSDGGSATRGMDGAGGMAAEGEGEGASEGEGEPWRPGADAGTEGEGEGEGPAEGEGEGPAPRGCESNGDCDSGAICLGGRCIFTGGGGGGTEPELPREERLDFGPVPVQGDRYVFVALPATAALARIDSEALSVDEVPLRAPARAVVTLPGRDVCVVLTALGTAAVVASEEPGEARVAEVQVRSGLTHLTAAEASPWVVAWADHDQADAALSGNPSEVTAIDLSDVRDVERVPPLSYHLSVGARPRSVRFDDEGRRLLVVTDDGVSAVSLDGLDGDRIVPPLPVHDDPLAEPEGRRVLITPDGQYALVLQPDDPALRLVDLAAEGPPAVLRLEAAPTDLALVPGEGGHRAVAVLRSRQQALLLDVPEDFEDGLVEVVDLDRTVGQVAVAPTGEVAALFSNASEEGALVLLDLGRDTPPGERATSRPLAAPPRAVLFSPDGSAGVVFHPGGAGRPLFSLFTLQDGFDPRRFTPEGVAGAFSFTPAAAEVEPSFLVLLSDLATGQHRLLVVPTRSFIPAEVRLRAPPIDVGVITSTGQAFVTQDDPEGLITFVDLGEELETREVSRFRRNRRID